MQAIELWQSLTQATRSSEAETLQVLRETCPRDTDLELLDQLIAMRGPLCHPEDLGKPVTVLQVAEHRLGRPASNGADFQAADLSIIGGCMCGAPVAAYNACPSKKGHWLCLNGCIDGQGFDDVRIACRACGGCSTCTGSIDALSCPTCQSGNLATIGNSWRAYDDEGSAITLRRVGCECGHEWFEEVG